MRQSITISRRSAKHNEFRQERLGVAKLGPGVVMGVGEC